MTEEEQHHEHSNEQERDWETDSNLKTLFCTRGSEASSETEIHAVTICVPMYAADTVQKIYGGALQTIKDSTECSEI